MKKMVKIHWESEKKARKTSIASAVFEMLDFLSAKGSSKVKLKYTTVFNYNNLGKFLSRRGKIELFKAKEKKPCFSFEEDTLLTELLFRAFTTFKDQVNYLHLIKKSETPKLTRSELKTARINLSAYLTFGLWFAVYEEEMAVLELLEKNRVTHIEFINAYWDEKFQKKSWQQHYQEVKS